MTAGRAMWQGVSTVVRVSAVWCGAGLVIVSAGPSIVHPATNGWFAVVPALATAARANEEDARRDLDAVESELGAIEAERRALDEEAEALATELRSVRERLIETANRVQSAEASLSNVEAEIDELASEEADLVEELQADRAALASLLSALQRLSRIPPETAAVRPGEAIDMLRAGTLLGTGIPALDQRASALAETLDALAAVREGLESQRAEAASLNRRLDAERDDLEDLVSQREATMTRAQVQRAEAARRAALLGEDAEDLRDLIERLEAERLSAEGEAAEEARRRAEEARAEAERREREEAERRQREAEALETAEAEADARDETGEMATPERLPEPVEPEASQGERQDVAALPPAPDIAPGQPPTASDGTLIPASGSVTTNYGEADGVGGTARGLTIRTRENATVVAPRSGAVQFAGPFRTYGRLLILQHSDGYHTLIAGLSRIDAEVGQDIAAGEPIGRMGASAAGETDLYFEVRRNGQPVNPRRAFTER